MVASATQPAANAFAEGTFATTNMVTGAATGVDMVSPAANLATQAGTAGVQKTAEELAKQTGKTFTEKLTDSAITSTTNTAVSTGTQALQGSLAESSAKEAQKKAEAEALKRNKITTANYGGMVGATPLQSATSTAPKTDVAAETSKVSAPTTTTQAANAMDYRNFSPTTTPATALYNPQGARA
jgi:hypothetical protein